MKILRILAEANPEDRAKLVLSFMEAHPDAPLELGALDKHGAMLDGIDFSPETLHPYVQQAASPPVWWNVERQAIDLRKANLRGASLRYANLKNALLEKATLAEADLAGAKLQGADLSGADLQGALLEDAECHKTVLRFARGCGSVWEEAKARGADFWGADMEGADLSGADLQEAILEESNFRGTDLAGTDLRGAILKRADLSGANLQGADLRGAALGKTNLENALLREAKIQELDFTECNLNHIHTCATRMERTRLDQEQLGGVIGEEIKGDFGSARRGYLALERNFNELGDHDGARWAYGRRRRMEKWQARQDARGAWSQGRWGKSAQNAIRFTTDQLVEWICDYGESVFRVLCTLLLIYVLFIPIYSLTGTVLRVEQAPAGPVKSPTYDLADLALFSLTAMTSPGNPPDYLVPRNEWAYLLSGVQTLLSIFLTGLMGFVAGNRIRR